jgi:hypothetical protein
MVIRRMSVLTVLLAAVLAAAGCARDAGTGESAGAPAPASSSPAAPESTQLPATELPDPSKPAPGAAGAKTISGTVTAGVEPNCLLLTGGGAEHLLVFDDPAMRAEVEVGAKVTVTGRAQPDQLSTCQQGIPFIVTAVQPN